MKRIKVRFNLGKGKNYMKWKIEYPSGVVEYVHPTNCQLVMKNCQLKNSRKTAEKIFNGQHKTVCAWVLCDDIEVKYGNFITTEKNRIMYNPKKFPYWTSDKNDTPYYELCLDNCKYEQIHSIDYKLFTNNP